MRLLERLLERRFPVPRQPNPPDRVGQLELLNEQITARLTRQLEEISALDNKATTILAAEGDFDLMDEGGGGPGPGVDDPGEPEDRRTT